MNNRPWLSRMEVCRERHQTLVNPICYSDHIMISIQLHVSTVFIHILPLLPPHSQPCRRLLLYLVNSGTPVIRRNTFDVKTIWVIVFFVRNLLDCQIKTWKFIDVDIFFSDLLRGARWVLSVEMLSIMNSLMYIVDVARTYLSTKSASHNKIYETRCVIQTRWYGSHKKEKVNIQLISGATNLIEY